MRGGYKCFWRQWECADRGLALGNCPRTAPGSPSGGSPQPHRASPSAMLTTARRLGAASAANSADRDGHRKIVRCPRAGGPPGCPQGRGWPARRPIQSNRCCPAGATVRLSSSALQPAEAPRPSRSREAARCAEADPRGRASGDSSSVVRRLCETAAASLRLIVLYGTARGCAGGGVRRRCGVGTLGRRAGSAARVTAAHTRDGAHSGRSAVL